MKVVFFIDNRYHVGVDYSRPELGNPGIGGTQYMFWSVACFLKKQHPEVEVIIAAQLIDTMPADMSCIRCDSEIAAIAYAKECRADILVLRGPTQNEAIFDAIDKSGQRTIFWSHNPENCDFADKVYQSPYIYANVCVGRQQLDRLRDHPVFEKSLCIFNGLEMSNYTPAFDCPAEDHKVCYMGALVPEKGFDILAKAWPKVIQRVPDAELYVLGGTNLYGRNWAKDVTGDGRTSYEQKIRDLLKDCSSTVHFMGVMHGEAKLEIMRSAQVGVINPAGTETFGIGAIEFEALGVPVVSRRKNGTLDTVCNRETGLLAKKHGGSLPNHIVKLLLDAGLAHEYGMAGRRFVLDNFAIEQICEQWYVLLSQAVQDEPIAISYQAANWYNDLKWLREINRRLRRLPIFSWLPPIIWYRQIAGKIKRRLMRCISRR